MGRIHTEFTRTTGAIDPAKLSASNPPEAPFEGAFLAAAALGIPGAGPIFDSVDIGTVWTHGDSLVEGAPEKMRFGSDGHLGTFETEIEFFKNDEGRLARLATIFSAASFEEAEAKSYEVFSRAISMVSFVTDTPLEIKVWMVSNMTTMESRINAILKGRVKVLPAFGMRVSRPSSSMLAAYGDALAPASPILQVLSLFKILEAVSVTDVRDTRASPSMPVDRLVDHSIPLSEEKLSDDDLWSCQMLEPYFGMSYKEVYEGLRASLRDDLAHLIPSTRVYSTDCVYHFARCADAVPVLRHMARRLLSEEFLVSPEEIHAGPGGR